MRQVTDIERKKRTFNLSITELKKGDWLKEVPDSDMVEILFKNQYLTISDCSIKRLDSEKESGNYGRNKGNYAEPRN